jgi:nitrogen regulatory protein PII
MSFLVVFIVDNPESVPDILNAWEEVGVLGVTILESTGMGRFRRAGLRDDVPLMPSLRDLLGGDEIHHRTLLSVVEGEEMVDRMIAAAENVIGDLDDPHTGFLFVTPVVRAAGMGKHRLDRSKE